MIASVSVCCFWLAWRASGEPTIVIILLRMRTWGAASLATRWRHATVGRCACSAPARVSSRVSLCWSHLLRRSSVCGGGKLVLAAGFSRDPELELGARYAWISRVCCCVSNSKRMKRSEERRSSWLSLVCLVGRDEPRAESRLRLS